MQKEKRYLITTADERTWKFDQPIVFIGEWCRVYSRKTIWKNMDAVVARPYGLELAKKDADFFFARELINKLFPKFCHILNQFHGTQHSERFWKIVLGHWFRRVIDVLINRIKTIKQCLFEYEVSGTTAISCQTYSVATQDSNSAIWAFNDDIWNGALTGKILTLLKSAQFPIEYVSEDTRNKNFFEFKYSASDQSNKRIILRALNNTIFRTIKIFTRKRDAFIINSYLPFQKEVELYLALGQVPRKWVSPNLKIIEKSDKKLRDRLSNYLKIQTDNELEGIIALLIFELLPICYLEGYKSLNQMVSKQPWPKFPKFIFTSNNFDSDEIFKLWAAHKIETGSKYFAGQHGNSYGTYRYRHPSIEEETADRFLTWGWTDGLPQHVPAFIFKTVGRNKKQYNSNGGLLLIEVSLPHRISTWDSYAEFGKYFDEQIDFVEKLGIFSKQKLTIRLHAGHRYAAWNEEARWHDLGNHIKIDSGRTPIKKLIKDSRLVVHSYDSTGILETMSLNIPTIAFWQNGFDHLRESAKPFYQLLVDAEIVHLSPEHAAKHVNAVWNSIDDWWFSQKVQDARVQFCSRYARESGSPIRELKQILVDSQIGT